MILNNEKIVHIGMHFLYAVEMGDGDPWEVLANLGTHYMNHARLINFLWCYEGDSDSLVRKYNDLLAPVIRLGYDAREAKSLVRHGVEQFLIPDNKVCGCPIYDLKRLSDDGDWRVLEFNQEAWDVVRVYGEPV